ncbi:MAG: hypothetical protein QOE33_1137 [Acidobacteriota bacterium]|nr:hypothetical protein [Acidobacteriota bacterium]
MKKYLLTLPSLLCTIGAAILGMALAKDSISKIITLPEKAYSVMLIAGVTLILLGLIVLLFSVVSSPTKSIIDKILFSRLNSKYVCVQATQADLPQLHDLYTEYFGADVPSVSLMRSWMQQYRKTFAMVYRVNDMSIKKKEQVLVGSYKILLITEEAVRELERGQLSGSTFMPKHIARRQKDAAAYYVGDVVATTQFARGVLLGYLNAACEQAIRKGFPIYARPLTSAGRRVMTGYGFVLAADGKTAPELGRLCKLVTNQDKSYTRTRTPRSGSRKLKDKPREDSLE